MSLRAYLSFVTLLLSFTLMAQDSPLWLRYPAISPDGQSIVFSYQGDLYKVAASGGSATPLTLHEGRDFMPVWSADGQQIAFASERYGNYDVFVMPAAGGTAQRLTWHSSNDYPTDFTPDGTGVLFSSSRLDDASNQQFPSGVLSELYQVPTQGGTPDRVLTTPAEMAQYSPDGQRLVFHDRKGYEDEFRKHHQSSVARDIWVYDFTSEKYQQVTDFPGEDRNPVFVPGSNAVFYLSESSGTFNVHRMDLSNPTDKRAVTTLEKHPVRNLSVSDDGLLCFSWNGELYTLREGNGVRKVNVQIRADQRYNPNRILQVNKNISEYDVAPNGKEIVFVHRGEVFVSSVSKGTTKRITHTPTQERSVSFSPDGRSILYAGERDGSWNVYQTSLVRDEEKFFFSATVLNEEVVIATEKEEFQPAYSPDGKEVAYLEERTALKVVNLESKESRLIMPADRNYSYSDGDQHFAWSPDSKWLLVEFLQNQQWIGQAGLVSASGDGEIVNLTRSGYGDFAPRWMMKGKMMLWFSDRDGMKNDASWGGQADAYGMFFTQEAYDRFKLSKEELEVLKEEEKEEKEEEAEEKEDKKKEEKEKDAVEPLTMELDDIQDRKVRLTIHSSDMSDAWVSEDGENLYYLARFEKGYDLWKTELRTRDTRILTKLGAGYAGGLIPDKKGEHLFLIADGRVHKIKLADGSKSSVNVSGEMVLDETAEREYLFDHAWRQVEKKFYLTDLHEVAWEDYKAAYARFLPHINNNYDFAEMLSELLGELNASHTGARYWKSDNLGDRTSALGLFFDTDYEGPGRKVVEVMEKGPLDKSDSKMKAGVVIEKIDGIDLDDQTNYFSLLNRKSGKNTLLSLYDPATKTRWEEVVQPISMGAENELRYKRWVENCRKIVEEASDGTIGYVHVRGMNDRSFRVVYEEALGRNHGKEALIVDTRFNGGGWLHDDLVTFLDGKKYMTFMPRGQNLGSEPQFKWTKPSIVVMSESNYSDAHMFPYAYKALGVGKLVGAPVPGTGTAVWWERLQNGMVFGIPQVGMQTNDGEFLENTQLEPDVKVLNDPNEVVKGKDPQLEAAVKELKKVIKP